MSGDEIAVALAAILLGSAIKSISGMGLPLVSIPIISFVTDLETAVAAVAIPNLLINVAMAWRSRESRAEARDLERRRSGKAYVSFFTSALCRIELYFAIT